MPTLHQLLQKQKKDWKEIEPETIDHLATVIMCMLDEDTGELRDKHYQEVKDYIENWVKYRSLFVRDLLSSAQQEIIEAVREKVEGMKKGKEFYTVYREDYNGALSDLSQWLTEEGKEKKCKHGNNPDICLRCYQKLRKDYRSLERTNYLEQQLSNCCEAPIMTSTGDEGTSCYICRNCKKACDPKSDHVVQVDNMVTPSPSKWEDSIKETLREANVKAL